MQKFLYFALLAAAIDLLMCLEIVNITSPIDLTYIFIDKNIPKTAIEPSPGLLTYYIDPIDSEKYLWLGMSSLNNPEGTQQTIVKSDIFTNKFVQYNDTELPFTFINSTGQIWVDKNQMCTSPITKNIITCWTYKSWTNYPAQTIYCKIYYVKTRTFSGDIMITDPNTYYLNDFWDVLCFNDSYFVPWIQWDNKTLVLNIYACLLDLNGNIVDQRISLNVSYITESYLIQNIFTTKGADSFNTKMINNDVTDIAMLNYQFVDKKNNMIYIYGLYISYTNINASTPIMVYNKVSLNPFASKYLLNAVNGNTALNWKEDCCYISLYKNQSINSLCAIITDIYGNDIGLGSILISKSSEYNALVLDLPMISGNNDATHYFMIGHIIYINNGLTFVFDVYYLKYQNTNSYQLVKYGQFVNLTLPGDLTLGYFFWAAYILPDTNYLFLSWDQQIPGIYPNPWSNALYAQTWEINN